MGAGYVFAYRCTAKRVAEPAHAATGIREPALQNPLKHKLASQNPLVQITALK